MKKIAFIVTVYKKDKLAYFVQAIESMVNQDYGFEYINIYLGIDGDLSEDIVNYIDENKALFYKVLQNEENRGLAYTLNRLIEVLEYEEYIFRMDSDDISELDRVTKQIAFMQSNPNIDIIGGAIQEIDEEGSPKMVRTYPKSTYEAIRLIPTASIFAHPTVCFRRSFFEKGFRYSNNLKYNQDLDLWYKVLANGVQVSNLEDIILQLRTTPEFYTRRNYQRAFNEFSIYWNGIINLYGFNWRLVYPIARLFTRLLPANVIEMIYNSSMRRKLNN